MVGRRSTLKTVRQYAVEQRRDQRSKVLRGKGGIADQQTRHRRDHGDYRRSNSECPSPSKGPQL